MRTQHQAASSTTSRAFWPDAVAYREAVQNPRAVLGDPELQGAEVVLDRRGLPLAYSGRFAVVFRLRTSSGDWALRCFTQAAGDDERRERYRAIARHLEQFPDSEHFVPFRYLEQGIRVGGVWFPVVAMRWAEGETLGRWVENHRHEPVALLDLCAALTEMLGALERAEIAHGDWQHDNLLVGESGRRITLVDYDGMFVPGMAGRRSLELGHPNFQHPARGSAHYGVGLDRFSCLVMQTALLALCEDASLWDRFSDGESILFKKSDLADPGASPVFSALRATGGAHLCASVDRLEAACETSGPEGVLLSRQTFAPLPDDLRRAAAKRRAARRKAEAASGETNTARVSYLDQVNDAAVQAREQWYLRRLRLSFLLVTAVTILLRLFLIRTGEVGPLVTGVLLNGLIFAAGYAAWPRVRLGRALRRELRAVDVALRYATRWDSSADFVTFELAKVPMPSAFLLGTIGHDTIGKLRVAGIKTAEDLRNRWNVRGIASPEWVTLKRWAERLEERAERRFAAERHAHVATAEQDREKAGLRRRREELARELTLFPRASWADFRSRLLKF